MTLSIRTNGASVENVQLIVPIMYYTVTNVVLPSVVASELSLLAAKKMTKTSTSFCRRHRR
jgi:hypothetical protein